MPISTIGANWREILPVLLAKEPITVNEKQSAVIRTVFLRWRKREPSRSHYTLVRTKLDSGKYSLSLRENATPKQQPDWNKSSRHELNKMQMEKERRLGQRVSNSVYKLTPQAWIQFFDKVSRVDAFQVTTEKEKMLADAFYFWCGMKKERHNLRLYRNCVYADGYVRFYIDQSLTN